MSANQAVITEVRVHGVSGTPPENALSCPVVAEMAGDGNAGFYRRATCEGEPAPPENGVVTEAFSWGHLTSGGRLRALWLLLAPFTLVNVAFFAAVVPLGVDPGTNPVPGTPGLGTAWPWRVTRRVLEAALRLLALALTMWSVLAAVSVAMDIVGWQYTRLPADQMAGWLRFLHWGWLSQPQRQYAITALVPLGLVIILWILARQTWAVLERTPVRAADPGDPDDLLPLEDRRMWNGQRPVALLRSVHLLAALGVVAAALVMPLWLPGRGTAANPLSAVWHHPDGPAVAVVGLIIAACLAVTVVLASLPLMTGRKQPGDKQTGPGWKGRLHWLGVPLVAAAAAVVWHGGYWRSAWPTGTTGPLPGISLALDVLFAATCLLLLIVAIAAVLLRFAARHAYPEITGSEGNGGSPVSTRPAWYGAAPAVLGTLGSLLIAGGAAGLTMAAARLLGHPASVYEHGATTGLIVPTAFYWAAAATTVSTLGAALALLAVPVTVRLCQHRYTGDVRNEWASHDLPRDVEDSQVPVIARAWSRAGIDAPLRRLLLAALLVTVLSIAAAATGYLLDPSWISTHLHALATLGILALALAATGLINLGRKAFSDAGTRRTTGILWDIAAFWPRAAHPLAPPCYMERALPALVEHIEHIADSGPDPSVPGEPLPVVLSCHSQGTVIGATVLMQLTLSASKHVALLTYGSPLRRIYTLFFPAYFSKAQLQRLGGYLAPEAGCRRALWRWRNLYRPSDMIGGPVFTDYTLVNSKLQHDVDRWLLDPSFEWTDGDVCPPPVRGHSGYVGYPDDQGYREAFHELTGRNHP